MGNIFYLLFLKEIAEESHMPYRFLTKIVQPLIKAKLVQAKEGKNGGYILTKKPDQIKLKYILEALCEPLSLARCLAHQNCNLEKGCKMKIVWTKIKKSMDKELNKLTLKDLI